MIPNLLKLNFYVLVHYSAWFERIMEVRSIIQESALHLGACSGAKPHYKWGAKPHY